MDFNQAQTLETNAKKKTIGTNRWLCFRRWWDMSITSQSMRLHHHFCLETYKRHQTSNQVVKPGIDVMLECHWIIKRERPDVLANVGIPFYESLSAGHAHIQVLIIDDVLLLPFCLQKRLELNVGVYSKPRQRFLITFPHQFDAQVLKAFLT